MPGSGTSSSDSRGQVLLIAAVGIALMFVSLSLVFNAVVVSESLWSHEEVDGVPPVETQQSVVRSYQSAVFFTNFYAHNSYARLDQHLHRAASNWSVTFRRFQQEHRRTVDATIVETTNGTTLAQRQYRTFTSKEGLTDWTLIESTDVRRFTMGISTESLASVGGEEGGVSVSSLQSSGAFYVELEKNGAPTRKVYFYQSSESGDATVAIVASGVVKSEDVNEEYFVVDFTEGTISGNKVSWFPGVSPPYTVSFGNGDRAEGHYVLVVDKTEEVIENGGSPFYDDCGADAPCTAPAIFSVVVRYSYDAGRVNYRTNVTIAPEGHPWAREPGPVANPGSGDGGGGDGGGGDGGGGDGGGGDGGGGGGDNPPTTITLPGPGSGPSFGVCCTVHSRTVFLTAEGESPAVVRRDGGQVKVFNDVAKPQVLGPALANIDGEGGIDMPIISSSGRLKLIDLETRQATYLGITDLQNRLIAVGDYDQDGVPAVYFVGSDNNMYKYERGVGKQEVAPGVDMADSITAISGVADFDGDDEPELVYINNQKNIVYLDDGAEIVVSESIRVADTDTIGFPADFDGDGVARIPVIINDEEGHPLIWLVSHTGEKTLVSSTQLVSPAPLAPADIDQDGELEIVYAQGDKELVYVEVVGPRAGDIFFVNNANNIVIGAKSNYGAR